MTIEKIRAALQDIAEGKFNCTTRQMHMPMQAKAEEALALLDTMTHEHSAQEIADELRIHARASGASYATCDLMERAADALEASPPSSDGLREALQAMLDRFGHVACMQVGQAKLALSTNPSSDADALREALARIVKGARLSSAFGSEFRAGDGRLDHIDLDAADAILALIECSGALYEAASGIADDYMTSEHHHPGYVLIPTAKFEAIRAALQPSTGRG